MKHHHHSHDHKKAKHVVSKVAASMSVIDAYVQSMSALPLGPQPVVIGGQQAGTFDPLGGTPQLESALGAAQQDCLSQCLTADLTNLVGLLQASCNPVVQSSFETIKQVTEALKQSNSQPTSAQIQQVQTALQNISQAATYTDDFASAISSEAGDFIPQVAAADQTLNQGSGAISAEIAPLQQWVQNTVEQYAGLPGGEAIAEVVAQIGGQMIADLQTLSAGLAGAAAEGSLAVEAATDLSNFAAGVSGYYADLLTQLDQISAEQLLSFLEKLHVKAAEKFWNDLTDYVTSTGLGVASSPP
jgi:hypothetical protein